MTDPRKIDSATDLGQADDEAAGSQHAPSASSTAVPYSDAFGPDEIAPVDWQADPAHWLPGRSLWIVAGIILVLTIATIAVCLMIWSTPTMEPVKIPTVPKG